MSLAKIMETTFAEISLREASGSHDDADVSAARIACNTVQSVIADLVLPAATPDQIRRVREARLLWGRTQRVVLKALRGGDGDDRVCRQAIANMWSAMGTELLIRENEAQLAEIEGSPFPRLRVAQ